MMKKERKKKSSAVVLHVNISFLVLYFEICNELLFSISCWLCIIMILIMSLSKKEPIFFPSCRMLARNFFHCVARVLVIILQEVLLHKLIGLLDQRHVFILFFLVMKTTGSRRPNASTNERKRRKNIMLRHRDQRYFSILSNIPFTLSTKHRKSQYIFPATVHISYFHFTTYDLRCFATEQIGP